MARCARGARLTPVSMRCAGLQVASGSVKPPIASAAHPGPAVRFAPRVVPGGTTAPRSSRLSRSDARALLSREQTALRAPSMQAAAERPESWALAREQSLRHVVHDAAG